MNKTIQQIQQDLNELAPNYEVILFGSRVEGGSRPQSDYDIAMISKIEDPEQNWALQKNILGKFHPIYDIQIFELFPLTIQMAIINNYQVVFGDPLEISEYFYQYRKIWQDCVHRIQENQITHYSEYSKDYIDHD